MPIYKIKQDDKKEYLNKLDTVVINKSLVSKIEKKYNCTFPETVAKIISSTTKSIFFDDGTRILSFSEILNAENDLDVRFTKLGFVPLVDCGENDFIVFNVKDNVYSIFNIIDKCDFKRKNSFDELLVQTTSNQNLQEEALEAEDKKSKDYFMSMQKFKGLEIVLHIINDTESKEYEQFLSDLKVFKSEFNKIEKECIDKLYDKRWDSDISKSEMKKLMYLDSIIYYYLKSGTRLFEVCYNGKKTNDKFFGGHTAVINIKFSKKSTTISDFDINIEG